MWSDQDLGEIELASDLAKIIDSLNMLSRVIEKQKWVLGLP
jgi:hypothetical protein